MKLSSLPVVVLLSACAFPGTDESSAPLSDARTVVSLTFDDTLANTYEVGAMASARGIRVTYYVNSGRLGLSGYMSRTQLLDLQAQGHEIAGHTTSHVNVSTLSEDEMRRQICNDRAALLDQGFNVTSFAFPFSGHDATSRRVVAECGYNSARLVGGLVTQTSCNGCPYANQRPPTDPYQIRTNGSVRRQTTLAEMQAYVIQAEQNGGGWVPFVFHHVCDGCNEYSVSAPTLAAFMDWLAARGPATQVGTVHDVIGGAVRPVTPAPQPGEPTTPGSNLLKNPSLETDANANAVPDCWQRGGFGTNTASYALVSNAFHGNVAQQIRMTSFTSGARRLVSQQDLGGCAPPVTPGHRYTMTAQYTSDTQPIFSVYYRTSAGGWVWFAQSPRLPASSSYRHATYTTPAMPPEATAISVGLSLLGVGSLVTDAYELFDADAAPPPEPEPEPSGDTVPPTARVASPANGATVSGTTAIWADVSDNVGVYRVRFYLDGRQLGTRVQTSYRWMWDTTTTTVGLHELAVQAEDEAGNATRSASITVRVVR